MNRRTFLECAAWSAGACLAPRGFAAAHSSQVVSLRVLVDKKLSVIPADFIGLGYEASSVAAPGLLSPNNQHYVQLVRTLGTHGVVRVGGNNSDYAFYQPDGKPVARAKSSVITRKNLEDLKGFLNATGWRLIWGLNLGSGTAEQAVAEAVAVDGIMQDKLLAFEIGNEPDLYTHEGHRKGSYGYEDYLADFRRYRKAIRATLPHAPFAGPDAAFTDEWVTRFAADEGHDLRLLTEHYYRGGAGSSSSTLEELLEPDAQLEPRLKRLQEASQSSHVPYRICETNSFSGGGKPGVSDTFGAALWVLDFMFRLASHGAAGVNIETGLNQFDVISAYSPIGDDQQGSYTAKPDYYGMLAFAQASQGTLVAAELDTGGVNLTAYPVMRPDGGLVVTIINKDEGRDADVQLAAGMEEARGQVVRLAASSLGSLESVTLAGAAVDERGRWFAGAAERVSTTAGRCRIRVGAGSAALVTLERN